ncbi:MAG: TetR/AcrR family transcriptional regulator [Actinomycetes bacterium]
MPRVVNHEKRRQEVAAIAAEVVVREGRAGLTVRNVAHAAGCSTTVVSHYFTDMAELFYETYSFAAGRSARRIQHVLEKDPANIAGLIEAVLPLDQERTEEWRIWFAFWSEALTSPQFASEQRTRARNSVVRIDRCLRLLQQSKKLPPTLNIAEASDRLAALIPGIASEAIFDPQKWPASRQRQTLRSELQLLGLH